MIPSEANVTERSQAQEHSKGTRSLLFALFTHHGQQPPKDCHKVTASQLPPYTAQVAKLWRKGKNTAEIAAAVSVPESEIANRLPAILAWCRQIRGGRNG